MNYFLRTAVLPDEIPLPFSNKQLYLKRQLSEKKMRNNLLIPEIENGLRTKRRTIPLKFMIKSRLTKERELSLIHPISQINISQFFLEWEKTLISISSNSIFSVRAPRRRNADWINELDTDRELIRRLDETFVGLGSDAKGSENLVNQYRSYFSFSKAATFGNMFENPEFKRAISYFSNLSKVDVRNFFPSIYTHSFAWSVLQSKARAKINTTSGFGNLLDKQMQNLNFGETNGIVVGPDFSRFVVEILFANIDVNVENELRKLGYEVETDYQIFRFVDDIFIFYNDSNVSIEAINNYKEELSKINLKLNSEKESKDIDISQIFDSAVNEVKDALNIFSVKRRTLYESYTNSKNQLVQVGNTRGDIASWRILFNKVVSEAVTNKNKSSKIINYFLSSLTSQISVEISGNTHKYLLFIQMLLDNFLIVLKISPLIDTFRWFYIILRTMIVQIESSDKSNTNTKNKAFSLIQSFIIRLINFPWFDFEQGYDFLLFSKRIRLKSGLQPDSMFLIQKIRTAKNKYFVWTAVANYILDENDSKVLPGYETTFSVLEHELSYFITNPPQRGLAQNDLLGDSEWFYIVNDFRQYPAISHKLKENLDKEIKKYLRDIFGNPNSGLDLLCSESYYRWNLSMEEATDKLIYKKIMNKVNPFSIDISF